MKQLLLSLSLFAFLIFTSCRYVNSIVPNKNYIVQKVNVGKFKGISTSSSIDVIYTQTSGTQDIEIYASENVMPYIIVNVENDMLKVKMKNKTNIKIFGSNKIEVRVNAPSINKLKASSSGDIILKNGLNAKGTVILEASSSGDIKGGDIHCNRLESSSSSSGDVVLGNVKCVDLDVSCNSSGDFKLKSVECENIEANTSSAGDVYLIGKCNNAKFDASSSGDINAKKLVANYVKAKASSAGDVHCYAIEELIGKKSSAGDIYFSNKPKRIEIIK